MEGGWIIDAPGGGGEAANNAGKTRKQQNKDKMNGQECP